jgi:hypothetical protein
MELRTKQLLAQEQQLASLDSWFFLTKQHTGCSRVAAASKRLTV